MLVELFFTCSAAGAVLGGCSDSCTTTIGQNEVILCEQIGVESETEGEQGGSSSGSGWTPPPPWILCEIYVSGGVEIETFGTIWVKSRQGTRECLREKEYVPIPKPPASSEPVQAISDVQTLQEIFRTSPSRPKAFASPAEGYFDEHFDFRVERKKQTKSGWLFDEPVSVRFLPKSATWSFGEHGFSASHVYGESGDFTAHATVKFQVDYKPIGGTWVINAGSISVKSNSLLVTALPLPRETRLIG